MPTARLLPPRLESLHLNGLCLNYRRIDPSLWNETYRKYHLHNDKLCEGIIQSH